MEALQGLLRALRCPLCSSTFVNPHSFGICGHTFCHDCVIVTLEGPGINKSECPVCHKPGWKNDLHFNHGLNNAVEHAQGLLTAMESEQSATAVMAGATLPPMHTAAGDTQVLHPAIPAARGSDGGGAGAGADPTAAGAPAMPVFSALRPPSSRGCGSKLRRRGRSVQEEQPEEQQPPLQEQPPQQQLAVAGLRKRAGSIAPVGVDKQAVGAAAGTAACNNPAPTTGSDPAPTSDASPAPTTPELLEYDSDWEERMLVLLPADPEEVPALESELSLLRQALLDCDQLPCLGGLGQAVPVGQATPTGPAPQAAPAAGSRDGASASAVAAARGGEGCPGPQLQPPGAQQLQAGKAGAVGQQEQQEAGGRGVGKELVYVPDTEEPGLLPLSPLRPVPTVPASAAGQQPQQAPVQDRKRHLAALRQPSGRQQGPGEEEDDEDEKPCMSGRKRRKGTCRSGRQLRVQAAAAAAAASMGAAPSAGRSQLLQQRQPEPQAPGYAAVRGKGPLVPVYTDGNSSCDNDFKQPQQHQAQPQPQQTQGQGEQRAQVRQQGNRQLKQQQGKPKPKPKPKQQAKQTLQRKQQPRQQQRQLQRQQQQEEKPRQQQREQSRQPRQQKAAQLRGHCKEDLQCGDVVEVQWDDEDESTGVKQPVMYRGWVTTVGEGEDEGQHQIQYVDGDVQWHNLDEERWRPLPAGEFDLVTLSPLQQRSSPAASSNPATSGSQGSGVHATNASQSSNASRGSAAGPSSDADSASLACGGVGASNPGVAGMEARAAAAVAAEGAGAVGGSAPADTAAAATVSDEQLAEAAVEVEPPAVDQAVAPPAAFPAAQAPAGAALAAESPQEGAAEPAAVQQAGGVSAAAATAPVPDPYAFQSFTEMQPEVRLDEVLRWPQAQHQPQRQPSRPSLQQAQALQVQVQRKRPLAPPPKFGEQQPQKQQKQQQPLPPPQQMAEVGWLQAHPSGSSSAPRQHAGSSPAAGSSSQQHFSRKRKGPEAEAAASTGSTGRQEQAALGAAPGEQPPGAAEAVPMVQCSEDAAEALVNMRQEQQAAKAAAGAEAAAGGGGDGGGDGGGGSYADEALPLRATSRHNAAAGGREEAAAPGPYDFMPASQLFGELAGAEAVAGTEQQWQEAQQEQQQQQQCWGAAAGRGTASCKRSAVPQNPSLFASGSQEYGSQGTWQMRPGASSQGAKRRGSSHGGGGRGEDPNQRRLTDLFKGASPSQPSQAGWQSDSCADTTTTTTTSRGGGSGEQLFAMGAGTAGAAGCSRFRRVCIVIGNINNDIQQKVLRLQQMLPGVDIDDHVSERTTHVLVPVNNHGLHPTRSMQYLMALAHGCWAVSHEWVGACLEAGKWVPERHFEAKGTVENPQATFLARKRHSSAPGSSAHGLFAGLRVHFVAEPKQAGGGGAGLTGRDSKLAMLQAMVAAESGQVVTRAAQPHGPKLPSLEGGALLVYVARTGTPADAEKAKQAVRHHAGRPLVHSHWVIDSLCQGRCLDTAPYAITEARTVPRGVQGSRVGSQLGA